MSRPTAGHRRRRCAVAVPLAEANRRAVRRTWVTSTTWFQLWYALSTILARTDRMKSWMDGSGIRSRRSSSSCPPPPSSQSPNRQAPNESPRVATMQSARAQALSCSLARAVAPAHLEEDVEGDDSKLIVGPGERVEPGRVHRVVVTRLGGRRRLQHRPAARVDSPREVPAASSDSAPVA